MPQRDDQALHFAQFGKDQRPGVGHVVGVEDVKDIAAAIDVADGCRVFRARLTMSDAMWCRSFRLSLHDPDFPEYFFLWSILTKTWQLQNIAKVIGLCRVVKHAPPSIALPKSRGFA